MTIKKNPEEAAATAKFTVGKVKTQNIADLTQKAADFAKNNPQYANQPAMQQAIATWLASATATQKADVDIQNARVSLKGFIAARQTALADWKRSTGSVVSVVNQLSAGSAKAIKEWGFDVNTRVVPTASNDPPENLRVKYTKALELVIMWKGVRGHVGYSVQIGDGTPTGWGPAIQVPRAKYMPIGLTPGQHIAIRVAVQRKNGLSAYCDAVTATVR